MTRTERLLRLARLRGDRLAIAVLEGGRGRSGDYLSVPVRTAAEIRASMREAFGPMWRWSEAEMRAAWGDR